MATLAASVSPSSRSPAPATRLPALDGLRGLAILLVLINNLYPERQSTGVEHVVEVASNVGWIGVDLFFVLSGFLITGILLDAKGSFGFFRNFYARRFLRIFPLYYGTLLLLLALAAWTDVGPAADRALFLERQGWFWTYTVNIMMWRVGPVSAKLGTGLFWSLSVEEQFYLLWPLIVYFLSRRTLVFLCGAMIVASLAFRIAWRAAGGPELPLYVLTPARMDALAMGALVAIGVRSSSGRELIVRWGRALLCGAWGLLLVILALRGGLPAEDLAVQTVGYSALAAGFAALLALTVTAPREHVLPRMFSHSGLRLLGQYSYGIYVFQGPMLFLIASHVPFLQAPFPMMGSYLPANLLALLFGSAIAIGLAIISWHGYEKFFLGLKSRFPSPSATSGIVGMPPLRSE